MKPIRQGDVWLYPVTDPAVVKNGHTDPAVVKNGTMLRIKETNTDDVILALGEVTGHAHRIRERNARLYTPRTRRGGSASRLRTINSRHVAATDRRFLVVRDEPVNLVHEEHETLVIPPGEYEVKIQREYQPGPGQNSVLVYD